MAQVQQASTATATTADDSEFVRFWNDVLGPKFNRFRHILVGGLSRHSEAVFPKLPVREGDQVLRLVRQEYDLAIDALEHALDLNPFLAVSHCGLGDSLVYEGRIEESVEHFERAIALSPHDPFRWAFYAYRSLAHLFGGDPETAARVARRAVQVPNAHFSAHANLLSALGHLGVTSQVAAARNALERVRPDFSLEKARARLFYIKRPEHLETYLEGLHRAGLR
ncbi:tetratricopeptide repeat protein [Aquibaculum arenosum]|uniref:Tetratricopeptide repeat protein n=1 Tax=Aquibaculum arenosum TaxID=3032591 RepID=A0ABT5YNY4_9PROT|nr:tetratricopeptide repeat protein [Fodinicurvata sp. CAU 1616]MDF2096592.1 tetratricopeptide repeat protein [Fodinicurvata sp. CAU 1616]